MHALVLRLSFLPSQIIILHCQGPVYLVRLMRLYSYEKLLFTCTRILKVLSSCPHNKPEIIKVSKVYMRKVGMTLYVTYVTFGRIPLITTYTHTYSVCTLHYSTYSVCTLQHSTYSVCTLHYSTYSVCVHSTTVHTVCVHSNTVHTVCVHSTTVHTVCVHSTAVHTVCVHSTTVHTVCVHSTTVHTVCVHSTTVHTMCIHCTAVHLVFFTIPSRLQAGGMQVLGMHLKHRSSRLVQHILITLRNLSDIANRVDNLDDLLRTLIDLLSSNDVLTLSYVLGILSNLTCNHSRNKVPAVHLCAHCVYELHLCNTCNTCSTYSTCSTYIRTYSTAVHTYVHTVHTGTYCIVYAVCTVCNNAVD